MELEAQVVTWAASYFGCWFCFFGCWLLLASMAVRQAGVGWHTVFSVFLSHAGSFFPHFTVLFYK